jgi:hypothetical protein
VKLKKTEHSGPKRGKGEWARKRVTKQVSRKLRRVRGKFYSAEVDREARVEMLGDLIRVDQE